MSQASVLYDLPGPRAVRRNRIISAVTIAVILGIFGLILYRMYVTGQFRASKWDAFQYQVIWEQLFGGLLNTLRAFAVAAVGAVLLGFVLAIARLSDHAIIRYPAAAIAEFLRAVPVLIFMLLLYYGLPTIGMRFSPFQSVVIALIAYNGSVLAEVIRAGVESLPKGQSEAGYAVGLRKSGVMRLILLPQAVRAMMPVIIAQLVVTLKDTALGFIITYNELLYIARRIGNANGLDRPIVQAALVAGAIYIAICMLLSWVATMVQKRTQSSPKLPKGQARPLGNVDGLTDTQIIAAQRIGPGPASGGGG